MRIKKIFNNNVLLATTDNNQDVIVSGRGIGFKRHAGDLIRQDADVQLFVLSQEERQSYEALSSEIPLDYLECTRDIVRMFNRSFDEPLHDSIALPLCDHIYTAVARFKDGKALSSALTWDIRRYYKKEFKLGLAALDIIEQHFKVRLPDDEAGFIALHVVNAEIEDNTIESTYQVLQIIQEITHLVKYHFSMAFDEDSISYLRFVNHLRFLAQRISQHQVDELPSDPALFSVLSKRYEQSYACVERINQMVTKKYNYPLLDSEKMYLIIHVERLLYTHSQDKNSD